jgi:hypothetical protein
MAQDTVNYDFELDETEKKIQDIQGFKLQEVIIFCCQK